MPELGTFGSVRGVPGDGHPYRNPRPKGRQACSEIEVADLELGSLRARCKHCGSTRPPNVRSAAIAGMCLAEGRALPCSQL